MRVKLEEPRVWVLYLTLWHDTDNRNHVLVVARTSVPNTQALDHVGE
jgi:hypothetical protein